MTNPEQDKEDGAAYVQASTSGGRKSGRRRGDLHEPEQSSQIWLISFTDVMALMLTFFVLLFSMTEPEQKNWSEITAALQSEFNKFYGAAYERGPEDAINIDRINFNRALNIPYLQALLDEVTQGNDHLKGAELIPQPGRLIISLPRDLLFAPGEAAVKEDGSRALYALGGMLARIRNKVEIAGNADPRPVDQESGTYDSNWDLSLQRAANVAAILEKVGYENEIALRGLGSGRYADLSGIADEEKRLDLSRRVDIIILDHDGSKQKVFFDPAVE